MIKNNAKIIFWSGIIGNSLDHYDSALYAFLAPFMAIIFFPETDPLVALILIYGIKSIGLFSRPLGAIIFGRMAMRYSVKILLIITLAGVSISTFIIGFIPGYSKIGILAPLLLVFARNIQGIFAAGEHNIAALFVLEQINDSEKHAKASSYYLCSTMAGTLLASLAATIVSKSSDPHFYWRIAFILGIITGICGIILRMSSKIELKELEINNNHEINTITILSENKWKILKLIPITSFTFVTYTVPFIFLNNFIPLFTNIKTPDLLVHNTILLVIDIMIIPIAGYLADKFNVAGWMAIMSSLLALTAMPLFALLPHLSIMGITLVKIWIIVIGVSFVAPLNALIFKMLKGREKYMINGLGYAIGTELLGRSTTPICLSLWYFTETLAAPAAYIAFVSACATLAILSETQLFVRTKPRRTEVL